MGRIYSAIGDQTVGADASLLGIKGATTIRPVIFEIIIGCAATPADQATLFHLQRFTAAGTATAVTPMPFDPDDPAALAAAAKNHTVEPTYTADEILLQEPLNQRATFRWMSLPEFGFMIPAVSNNGLGLKASTATGTADHHCTIAWAE